MCFSTLLSFIRTIFYYILICHGKTSSFSRVITSELCSMHLAVFFFWTPTVSLWVFLYDCSLYLKKDVCICVCGSVHLFRCNCEPGSNVRFVSRRCPNNEEENRVVVCSEMHYDVKGKIKSRAGQRTGGNSSLRVSHLSESYYTLMHDNNNLWLQ